MTMSVKRDTEFNSAPNPGAVDPGPRFEHAEVVAKNLDLAARWVRMIFLDPTLLDQIPEGANVVFLPEDDPELAEANRRGGEAMRRAGKTVSFIPLP
jgi:hypothetical protein